MSDGFQWDGFEGGARSINSAFSAAFNDLLGVLTTEFTKTISTPGLFAGYEGDIVDTGYFRSSLNNPGLTKPPSGGSVNVAPTKPVAQELEGSLVGEFTWHAEYSLMLHQGSSGKDGSSRPGRPWTEYTLDRFDATAAFTKLFQRYLEGG